MIKKNSIQKDLEGLIIPFDLLTGVAMVIEELDKKKFTYSHTTNEKSIMITYNSKSERVIVNIEKENLLIRQFIIEDEDIRKLKVVYVVKPSERTFKLI